MNRNNCKNETYWVAVMIGASLEPHLNTDGYAGYGCPNFKTKRDCEKWIKHWNRIHVGYWVEHKGCLACKTKEETEIYIKGINALGKKLIESCNNKLVSKWLKKTLIQLGEEYEQKSKKK